MSVDEVWRARLDAPHPKSYLAFVLGFHDEVERIEGAPPSLWTGPRDLAEVPRAKQAYWKHWNPILQTYEDAIRTKVNDRLAEILRPGLTFEHSVVESLAVAMFEGYRAASISQEAEVDARSEAIFGRYPIKAVWAFVYLLREDFRRSMPTASENALNAKTADYLSRGIPTGQARKYALNRNHVDRACKRFIENLMGRLNSTNSSKRRDLIIEVTLLMWRPRLDAIETIAKAAASEKEFGGKTGAELVAAIDRAHGAYRTFYRVLERDQAQLSA